MLTVYTAGGAWDAPDLSPFVTKLLTWLRMTKIEHREEIGDIRKAPKGKLPFVDDGGRKIGDSTLIIEHLQATRRFEPLPGDALSPSDAAVAAAFKGMIEGELYFVIVYMRWVVDAAFALYQPKIEASMVRMGFPSLLTPVFAKVYRHKLKQQAYQQGMGRHDLPTVLARGRGYIDAIAAYLADKPYFMGNEPGTIDATVYSFVASLLATPLTPELGEHVKRHENLIAYCDRMRARYWSDFVPA